MRSDAAARTSLPITCMPFNNPTFMPSTFLPLALSSGLLRNNDCSILTHLLVVVDVCTFYIVLLLAKWCG